MDLNMDTEFDMLKTDNIDEELLDLIVDNEEPTKRVVDKQYQTAVVRQLILNYLTEKSRTDSSSIYAKQFIITRWHYEDGEDEANHAYYETQWDVDPKTISKEQAPYLTSEGTYQLIVHSVSKRPLMKSFDMLLSCILHVLGESKTNNRTKAIKALTLIVEADPSTLGSARVQSAVRARFWDTSISVREATVDLIGKYILERPEFAEQYYDMVAERILDVGLSVRKRVITISNKICTQQPNNPIVTKILLALISRINDEEQSIRDMVLKTFKGIWFEKLALTSTTISKMREEEEKITMSRVQQIFEVLSSLLEKNCQNWIVDLLKSILKADAQNENKLNEIKNRLSKISDCIVEQLLRIEEEASTKSPVKKAVEAGKKGASRLVVYITALSLISQACPTALVSHIETLEPYLKSQGTDQETALVHQHVASILGKTVTLAIPSTEFINALTKDLSTLLYKSGMPVIQSCVKCLCKIVNSLGQNSSALESLYKSFYTCLDKYTPKERKPQKPQIQMTIIRSLFTIGNICKYHNFEGEASKAATLESLKKVKYGSHVENIFKIFTAFCQNEDTSIKVVALRGIGMLFATYPGIAMRALENLKGALSSTADIRLKNQALASLDEFLTDEEERMSEATDNLATTKSDDKDTINADTGVSGLIVQQFLNDILSRLFDKEVAIRQAALTLIMHILKRSLVHPIQCVAHLVALQGDHHRALADMAQRALVSVIDKDSKLVLSRLVDGIALSYKFQKEVFQECKALAITPGKGATLRESIFSRLYALFKGSKTTRQGFLHTLLRQYEIDPTNSQFLQYITRIIMSLSFGHQEEVLYIIYHINRLTSFSGSTLLSNLKNFYSTSPDGAVPAEANSIPGIVYLVRLKSFLKNFYNLSSVKCQGYDPATPEAKQTPLTNKLTVESVDCIKCLPLDDVPCGDWNNPENCKQAFLILKKEMKNDDNDFNILTTQTTTTKRKRPTKGGKRATAATSSPKKKQRTTKATTKASRGRTTKRGNSACNEDSDEEYEP